MSSTTDSSSSKENKFDVNGIPIKSSLPDGVPVVVLVGMVQSILMIIGFTIAYFGIYANNNTNSKIDTKIAILKEYDLGWLYVSTLLFKFLILFLGINLASARKEAKINVPDQQVYQVKGESSTRLKLGYVLMETDGPLGRFNRAQRSLQNYFELYTTYLLYFLLCGFVYPFETFVLTCFFTMARCYGCIGYTANADGRLLPNLVAGLAITTLEALVLICGFNALN